MDSIYIKIQKTFFRIDFEISDTYAEPVPNRWPYNFFLARIKIFVNSQNIMSQYTTAQKQTS